jgi:hypothetical protein
MVELVGSFDGRLGELADLGRFLAGAVATGDYLYKYSLLRIFIDETILQCVGPPPHANCQRIFSLVLKRS